MNTRSNGLSRLAHLRRAGTPLEFHSAYRDKLVPCPRPFLPTSKSATPRSRKGPPAHGIVHEFSRYLPVRATKRVHFSYSR